MKLDLENAIFHNASMEGAKKEVDKKVFSNEERLELFKKIEARAESLYGNLPYHNFRHACEALELGYEIIARCQASNIDVNSDVIRYAILFHDAGYHENHKEKGFESKEEYSAYLAKEVLREFGVGEDDITKVEKSILSTHRDKNFECLEEKIARAADLAGLAIDYETFKENAIKLKDEHELLTGSRISWEDWKIGVKNIIEFYLSPQGKVH